MPDGDPSLLLHTLTGHNGFAHSVQFTPTCIVSCDVTGLLLIRDFHSCVRERPGLRVLRLVGIAKLIEPIIDNSNGE